MRKSRFTEEQMIAVLMAHPAGMKAADAWASARRVPERARACQPCRGACADRSGAVPRTGASTTTRSGRKGGSGNCRRRSRPRGSIHPHGSGRVTLPT
jgi:hypothetical protein